jgi:cyclohexanecarboxylate-CoA ligase
VFACCGADVPPDLIRAAEDQLGVLAVRVYGSTEIPTLTMGYAEDTAELHACTDGRVVGAAEARVVDDDGAPVARGTVGRLLARAGGVPGLPRRRTTGV